jgi:hypothetical protein
MHACSLQGFGNLLLWQSLECGDRRVVLSYDEYIIYNVCFGSLGEWVRTIVCPGVWTESHLSLGPRALVSWLDTCNTCRGCNRVQWPTH